ncbi:peptidylprolyl isomerase [Consotaella salsifontis]|uniref:Periplasmic chaperone for outer membrane proteins SurA n=1 Tax=Consotaella salsifontis TaxID=1365950 RepID=A0A1T4SKT0_9HYPH|nr:peptidylprolyl isomerase [Consotaella salsifontis]SKA28773.1 periplasmic chaperone for outer membrane proteins SurA [Consotaella salsifontis]
MNIRALSARILMAGALAAAVPIGIAVSPAQAASEVKVVVNKMPITSYAIAQRAAFVRLRHMNGNPTTVAENELIDEALKRQEMRRRGIQIPDAMINQAYAKFASDNKLSEAQLGQVLRQAGFSADAFKEFIGIQIGWGEVVRQHLRQDQKVSEQDAVQRMLADGGNKPSTTEYTLQQVIFVVPESKKGETSRRMQEANQLRSRFTSCRATYDLAKGLRDVTVRDLGRVTQPELPPNWKDAIISTPVGRATAPKTTERGVEFIAVCDSQKISDDKVAAMVYQQQDMEALGKQAPGEDVLKTLRDKARIVRK